MAAAGQGRAAGELDIVPNTLSFHLKAMLNAGLLSVELLLWGMIIPMLLKIDVGALHQVLGHMKGIWVTLFSNWLVKPFSMAFLGCLFIRVLFANCLSAAPAPPWCLSGVVSPTAIPTSPCHRWR